MGNKKSAGGCQWLLIKFNLVSSSIFSKDTNLPISKESTFEISSLARLLSPSSILFGNPKNVNKGVRIILQKRIGCWKMSKNCILIGFCVAKVSITSSTLTSVSSLVCICTSPFNLSLVMVFRNHVFILRRAETDRSHSQVVTGATAEIFHAVKMFGNAISLQFRRVSATTASFPKAQFGVNGSIVRHVLSVCLHKRHKHGFAVKIFAIKECARDNVESSVQVARL